MTEMIEKSGNEWEAGAYLGQGSQVCWLQGFCGQTRERKNGSWQIYAPDFLLNEAESFYQFEEVSQIHLQRQKAMEPIEWLEPQFSDFKNMVEQAQNEMATGDLKKVVPVVFARSRADHLPSTHKILESFQPLPHLWSYGFWLESEGLMGQSPELLFEVEGDRLKTMAVAGTYFPSRGTSLEDFFHDPKENLEHDLVVEDLCERLKPFGALDLGPRELKSQGQIAHLFTAIEVKLNRPGDLLEYIQALHPTPALGVSPRSQKDWLPRLSGGVDRKRHGAPFALIEPSGKITCLVAIRNLQWDSREILLGSGCGIVSQSLVEREWDELKAKRDVVRRMFYDTN